MIYIIHACEQDVLAVLITIDYHTVSACAYTFLHNKRITWTFVEHCHR
jgi:hypothetical protein